MKEIRVYTNNIRGLKTHIHDVPIPMPAPDQVLIKVVVAGSNSKDWKLLEAFPESNGFNSGDDIAGIVESVGSEATLESRPGDRVAAFHTMTGRQGHTPNMPSPLRLRHSIFL